MNKLFNVPYRLFEAVALINKRFRFEAIVKCAAARVLTARLTLLKFKIGLNTNSHFNRFNKTSPTNLRGSCFCSASCRLHLCRPFSISPGECKCAVCLPVLSFLYLNFILFNSIFKYKFSKLKKTPCTVGIRSFLKLFDNIRDLLMSSGSKKDCWYSFK